MFPVYKKENHANEIINLSSSSSETDFDIPVYNRRIGKESLVTCNKNSLVRGNSNNKVQSIIPQDKDDNKNIAIKKKKKERKSRNKINNKKSNTLTCDSCTCNKERIEHKMKHNKENSPVYYVNSSTSSPTSSTSQMQNIQNDQKNDRKQKTFEKFKQDMAKYVDDLISKLLDCERTVRCHEAYYGRKPPVLACDFLHAFDAFDIAIGQLKMDLNYVMSDMFVDYYDLWVDIEQNS
ncbi:hypothetical protein WN48_02565 [Eufriesea mexicana]|uniref:Uncharacterized protein n=1 Tax=Eufriesea mexicana TaxID=516756 RepID=A0A310SQH7_9HYME|nr:hypothetical protein WN48_02565 [Eufriesea mexicana]